MLDRLRYGNVTGRQSGFEIQVSDWSGQIFFESKANAPKLLDWSGAKAAIRDQDFKAVKPSRGCVSL